MFFFGGGGACVLGNICTLVCGPVKMFRNKNVFCKLGNVGIMFRRFNGPGTGGRTENADMSGLDNGELKNDGMVVEVDPVVLNCCAEAGHAMASVSAIPRHQTRVRTVHLPQV